MAPLDRVNHEPRTARNRAAESERARETPKSPPPPKVETKADAKATTGFPTADGYEPPRADGAPTGGPTATAELASGATTLAPSADAPRSSAAGASSTALARPLDRQTMTNELWAMARVPGHALTKLGDAELRKTYDDVKTRIAAGPGKHEVKVGDHTLKMTVGANNQVTQTETKKPGVLSKLATVGKAALTVASFVPGPVGIAARVANGVISAVQAAKSKNILGAVGAAASAFGAGAAGLGSKALAGAARMADGASQAIRGVQGIQQGGIGGVISGVAGAASGALQVVGDSASRAAASLDKVAKRLAPVGAAESYLRAGQTVDRAEQALAAARSSGDAGAVAQAERTLADARRGRSSALLGVGAAGASAAGTFIGNRADPRQGRTTTQLTLDVTARTLGVARSVNDRDYLGAASGALGVAADVRDGTGPRSDRFDPLRAGAEVTDRLNATRLAAGAEKQTRAAVQAAEGNLARARVSGDAAAVRQAQQDLDRARRAQSDASLSSYYAKDELAQTAQRTATAFRDTRAVDQRARERVAEQQRQRDEEVRQLRADTDGTYAELDALARSPRAQGGFQTIAQDGLTAIRDQQGALDRALASGDDARIRRATAALEEARADAAQRVRTLNGAFAPVALATVVPNLATDIVIDRGASGVGGASGAGGPGRTPTSRVPGRVAAVPPVPAVDASAVVYGPSGPTAPGNTPAKAAPVAGVVRDNFSRWDADGDQYLSADEVDRAMLDPRNKGDQAAALAALKGAGSKVAKLSNDEWGFEDSGVTRQDLDALASKDNATTAGTLDAWYQQGRGKIAGANGATFATGKPSLDAIRQGSIGDCYFLAAIGAQVAQNPDAVRRMIDTNADGTYTVRLPGRDPVKVDAPTDAETAFYATAGQDGRWLAVLEKGYGQTRNQRAWLSTSTVPQDAADAGAMLAEGIGALTGHSADTDLLLTTTSDTTRSKLSSAMADGRVVTAGIRNSLPLIDRAGHEGLPMGHAYSVVGYDRKNDRLTLRNPWGQSEIVGPQGGPRDGRDDGLFTLTMAEFNRLFSLVSYEQR